MGGSYGDTWLLSDAAPRRKQNTEGPVYSDFEIYLRILKLLLAWLIDIIGYVIDSSSYVLLEIVRS